MGLIDKIKLLIKVQKPMGEIVNEIKGIKAGYKTLSFWVALLGSIMAAVAAFQGLIPSVVALITTTALTTIYNILRGLQNANMNGVEPVLKSTRFWVGVIGQLTNSLVALQTGGINPEWFATASTILAAAMAAAQSLGANQPGQPEVKNEKAA